MRVFVLALFVSSAMASLLANKGPVFSYPTGKNVKNQDDLIKSYLGFKGLYLQRDTMYLNAFTSHHNKLMSKERNSDLTYKLPKFHYDINNDAFSFNYGITGQYSKYPFLKIKYGLCMGFTVGLRKIHYFAHFEPGMKAPFDRDTEPKKWLSFMKRKLDRVFAGRPTIIPEFFNLYELSDSELKTYLQRHLTDQWAINNLSHKGLYYISNLFDGPDNKEEVQKLHDRIQFYLDRNFEPKIMHRWGEWQEIHVVRALSITEMQGDCFYIEGINTDNSSYWMNVCPGEKVALSDNEEARLSYYYNSYKKFCEDEEPLYCSMYYPEFYQNL
jgi:hypothetical protein